MQRIINGKEVWIEEKNGKKIYYYYDCPKCGNKKNLKSSYCIPCMNDKQYRSIRGIAASRGGLASIYEIYVELITLYNHFGRQSSIDTFDTNKQLSIMWKVLKRKKIIIENIKTDLIVNKRGRPCKST